MNPSNRGKLDHAARKTEEMMGNKGERDDEA
jgi:hypothetical protein